MGKVMVPIKKSLLAEIINNSVNIKSSVLSAEQLNYIRDEAISNFKFLGDYIKNMIDRFERMEGDPGIEYISNTCKDYEGVLNIIERTDVAFKHLEEHINSKKEKEKEKKSDSNDS